MEKVEKGAGEITIKFDDNGVPSIKLRGDLPDATRDHVQDLMGWLQKEKKDESSADQPQDDTQGLGPNNTDSNGAEKPPEQIPDGPKQIDPRAVGSRGVAQPANPSAYDNSAAESGGTGDWGKPVQGDAMSPAPHDYDGQAENPPPKAEDDTGPTLQGGVNEEGANAGQPQILPSQGDGDNPSILKEDAGLVGKPIGNQAPTTSNLPAELRAGPTPNLYGPSSQQANVNADSHVSPPGSQQPILDALADQAALDNEKEEQKISAQEEQEDKIPDPFQQPEQLDQPGQPGAEAGQQPGQPGEEMGQQPGQEENPDGLPPPKNFKPEQWNQLNPGEQIEYYELLEHMNDSITRHDHDGLRNTVTKLSEYQKRMKEGLPDVPGQEGEEVEEGESVEVENGGGQPGEDKKGKKLPLPKLTIEGEPPPGLMTKSVISIFGQKHQVSEEDLGKSARAAHVAHPQHHRPPRGGEYIRRYWQKGRWNYEYAKKPHENPKHHGTGENAVRAASLKLEHTISPHSDLVDHPDVGNAYEAYQRTILQHAVDSPEKITWVKEGLDGKQHVYRQNADKQSEVSYVKNPAGLNNPHEIDMKRNDRISLSAYNKKHMRVLHTPDVGDPALGWGVIKEYKNADDSPLAKLYHEEGTAKPWIIKEEGNRVLTADQPSNFRRFSSREAAQRFVDFHQWYDKAQQNNRGVELFENSDATSDIDPEKYPVLYDLETGKMKYKAIALEDERTGMEYRALVPVLSESDMESLYHRELKDVIKRSVNRFLQLHKIPATREVKKTMYKAAQSLAWEKLSIRHGGKKTGGFVPGQTNQSVKALIGATLRARSGPLLEELHDLTTMGESTLSEDQQREMHDRIFGDSNITFQGTITAAEWMQDHKADWITDQKQRWLLHRGSSMSSQKQKEELKKISTELNGLTTRNQAVTFAARHPWAKSPRFRGLVTSIAEVPREMTPEDDISLEQTQQRLTKVADELGGGDEKKKKFYSRLMANLFSGVVEELPTIMMEEMRKIWKNESEDKLQSRFVKYMEKFRSHPDVKELRTNMAMSMAQRTLNATTEELAKSHPAYRRIMDNMIKGKCQQFLNRVVEQIDPDRTAKGIVLKSLVPVMVNGTGGEILDQICSTYQEEISKHVGNDMLSVNDCKKHVAVWYGELRSHDLFKSVLWLSAAKEISDRADVAKNIASGFVVGSFLQRTKDSLEKAREGMVLMPSKTNPNIKRWQRIGEGRGSKQKKFVPPKGGQKREWIDHLEGMPKDTKTHHTNEAGEYHPERQKMHKEIHGKFLDHVPSVPDHKKPVAVVMMGGPAAGKGTLVNRILKNKKDFVNVNPDDVKDHIPEYTASKKANAKDAARLAHFESSNIAGDIFTQGVKQRKNILVDGTGKDPTKHEKTISKLKEHGYDVHLMMPDISKDTAKTRVQTRADIEGRSVPMDIVEHAHTVIPGNFERIAKMADSAHLYDNEGAAPRPVWSMYDGGKKQVHHDKEYVEQFKKKAYQ